ncbi:MAG: hypothetical protein ACXVXJ_00795, partial [Mycobacteriaceae bacterium]
MVGRTASWSCAIASPEPAGTWPLRTLWSWSANTVSSLGPELEHSPVFPDGANVEFVQIVARDRLRVRVWERGVGETMACGTGACAAAVAAARLGIADRKVEVQLPGGILRIDWQASGSVLMTGP